MSNRGTNFPFAPRREIAGQGEGKFAPDGGKGVAVEEKKGCPPIKLSKTVQRFGQR